MRSALKELDKREAKYTAELNEALQQYAEHKEQSRLDIRSDKERNALNQILDSYGEHFSRSTFFSSVRDADMKLDDEINMPAVREYVYQQRRQAHQQQRSRKTHGHER